MKAASLKRLLTLIPAVWQLGKGTRMGKVRRSAGVRAGEGEGEGCRGKAGAEGPPKQQGTVLSAPPGRIPGIWVFANLMEYTSPEGAPLETLAVA